MSYSSPDETMMIDDVRFRRSSPRTEEEDERRSRDEGATHHRDGLPALLSLMEKVAAQTGFASGRKPASFRKNSKFQEESDVVFKTDSTERETKRILNRQDLKQEQKKSRTIRAPTSSPPSAS